AVVATHPPTQTDRMAGGGRGQVHDRVIESARVARPGCTAGQRVTERAADRAVVPARLEAAACREDVLKGTAVGRDLEDAAVKAVFQVPVLPEAHLRRRGADREARRDQLLVADCR